MVGWVLVVTTTASAQSLVPWDAHAAEEVKAALHEMHHVWNTGDIQSLKKMLVGDDVLVTFELNPTTHEPILLTTREELWGFVNGIVDDVETNTGVFVLAHPKLNCRATKNLGICTEECSVTMKMPNGVEERYKLWSTATAVKYEDSWKWIQWHMSTAGPVEVYKDGKLVWKGHKTDRPRDLLSYSLSSQSMAR